MSLDSAFADIVDKKYIQKKLEIISGIYSCNSECWILAPETLSDEYNNDIKRVRNIRIMILNIWRYEMLPFRKLSGVGNFLSAYIQVQHFGHYYRQCFLSLCQ